MNGDLRNQKRLNPQGRAQAQALGEAIVDEPIEACFTSAFARTNETADVALTGCRAERVVLEQLNEARCGTYFEMRPYQEYLSWCQEHGLYVVPPGRDGNTYADTMLRVCEAFERAADWPGGVGLVIAHGVPVSMARRFLDVTDGRAVFPLPDAELATLYRIPVPAMREGIAEVRRRVFALAASQAAGLDWLRHRAASHTGAERPAS